MEQLEKTPEYKGYFVNDRGVKDMTPMECPHLFIDRKRYTCDDCDEKLDKKTIDKIEREWRRKVRRFNEN